MTVSTLASLYMKTINGKVGLAFDFCSFILNILILLNMNKNQVLNRIDDSRENV